MARMQEHGWHKSSRDDTVERVAKGLGWFSIGLGLAEVAAPGTMSDLVGVRNSDRARTVFRTYGAREIGNGIAILQSRPDPEWLWGRVGGDALDLATLVRALGNRQSDSGRVLMAIGAVAGVTALDAWCAQQLSRESGRGDRAASRFIHDIHVRKAYTINRQPDVVYGFWRKLENLPQFMRHLESVEVIDQRRSRWRARAPAGTTVEWEAEITEDRPNELIAWRSLEDSTVPNRGSVRFDPAPGARGTELRVELSYDVPGGRVAQLVAKLLGEEPEQQIGEDLRRLKQLLEAGEIARAEGGASVRQPAQPLPGSTRHQYAGTGGRQ
jgi:uncharacterized membrane protein